MRAINVPDERKHPTVVQQVVDRSMRRRVGQQWRKRQRAVQPRPEAEEADQDQVDEARVVVVVPSLRAREL